MSFLNQLKTQAKALQQQKQAAVETLEELYALTDRAAEFIRNYFEDLAQQLTVIEPPAPAFSLDGKTPWPAMKLADFRVDARRKMLRDREVLDYISIGWRVLPQVGKPVLGVVTANFPTDMRRIEDRLAMGPVKHQRFEVRLPESSLLQEVRYEYETQTRGSVMARPDYERGTVHFRMLNTAGFDVIQATLPVARIGHDSMDELARCVVGQQGVLV
ncbi:MAG TPA: hypothetical protein VHL79_11580 [Ramlibacter sp.]|jgi:hypothetical protein|nr:hypothetical protein [Ramlibacter sp.]